MNGWRADTIAAEAAFQAPQAFFLTIAGSAALGAGAETLDVDTGCWATSPDDEGCRAKAIPAITAAAIATTSVMIGSTRTRRGRFSSSNAGGDGGGSAE
jgi:hypothetical protein